MINNIIEINNKATKGLIKNTKNKKNKTTIKIKE